MRARGVGFVRIVGKHVEQAAADDVFALGHRCRAIGVADGNDDEIGIEHEIEAGSTFEQRPEVGLVIGHFQATDTGFYPRLSFAARAASLSGSALNSACVMTTL